MTNAKRKCYTANRNLRLPQNLFASDYSTLDERFVCIRPPVAEELPGVAHITNQIQIQVRNHQRVFITRRLSDELAARVAEIALAVKFADVPWRFIPDAIDRRDVIAIGHGM